MGGKNIIISIIYILAYVKKESYSLDQNCQIMQKDKKPNQLSFNSLDMYLLNLIR